MQLVVPLLAHALVTTSPRLARHSLRTQPQPYMSGGGSWWDALWAAPQASESVGQTVAAVCREDGWDVRCTLGAQVARELGGTGALAKQKTAASNVGLDFSVAFEQDEGFDPPQGTVRLLSQSRLLASSTVEEEAARAEPGEKPAVAKGFWTVDTTDDEEVPTSVRWRLQCAGITVGDDELVPPGPLYFNALVAQQPPDSTAARTCPVSLGSGRVTVKEEIGVNAVFRARGE